MGTDSGHPRTQSPPGQPRWRRRLLLAAVVLTIVWAASTWAVAWRLTRRPRPVRVESPPALDAAREDLVLRTRDGETLGAWWYEGRPGRPCVLVLHGINADRESNGPLIERLVRRGCTTLAISLRAHGDSTGRLNDIGWSARQDVIAAVDLLRERHPDRPLAIVGRSMGSAASIFAAGELSDRVQGYWLEQPYPTLDSAVWRRLQSHLPPVFDATAYAGMRLWAPMLIETPISTIAPVDHIAKIPSSCSIRVICGDCDAHLPLDDARCVFEPVRDRAAFIVIPGAGHVALDVASPELFERELDAFLDSLAPPSPALVGDPL
ncbi:MAG: alpha/beta fold hydrolase [Planctomyces sp.]|nr:alpha/beta fold hydrolase [Planctomyces sp.]